MAINPDFRDLFAELNAAGARYLLVGGYALAVHAIPRYTKDLDIWIDATAENAPRVMAALKQFGATLESLSEADLSQPGIVYQIGVPPNRVDIVTTVDGVEFDHAWPRRLTTTYADQSIAVIGRDDLIANKRACGRPQDLIDAELLDGSSA